MDKTTEDQLKDALARCSWYLGYERAFKNLNMRGPALTARAHAFEAWCEAQGIKHRERMRHDH